jgi:hypothetical protein
VFTDQIKAIMADVRRAERWLGIAGPLAITAMLVVGVWRWHRRVETERADEDRAEGHPPRPERSSRRPRYSWVAPPAESCIVITAIPAMYV